MLTRTLRREIIYETNHRDNSTGSQFSKLNPRENFFSLFRISKTYTFTLGSLSINDDHVKDILQDIKQCKLRQHREKNINLFIISALLISP